MKKTGPPRIDVLIANVRVFTADPDRPRAAALAYQGGRIVFVGSAEEAEELRTFAARIVDGQGCTLMPGFIDSHFHFELGALQLAAIQLDAAESQQDLRTAVLDFAAAHPHDAWLEGAGLHYGVRLEPGCKLGRRLLDGIVADRPLIVIAYDGHTAWANTPALQAAGLLHGRELPPGNEVVMDTDGLASGELREPLAYEPATDLIPKKSAAEKRALDRQAGALTARAGITSVYNMDGDLDQVSRLAEMDRAGEIPLRIYAPLSIKPEMPSEALEEAEHIRRDCRTERVRGGCVKFFIDGVIESYTGLLVDDYVARPGWRGEPQYDPQDYLRLVRACDQAGFQISTHAVGDGGVRLALDTYETVQREAPGRARRHRIEHIEVVHPDDLERFKALGVIASMQPLHCPLTIGDLDPWPARVGRDRWPLSFAWSDLRRAGARLVFGSDWPVVSMDPMLGIHAALNRRPWADGHPDHRQALDDTLVSYTRAGAHAQFMDYEIGMLRPGMLADLVLLNADLETVPPEEIPNVRPVMTVCNGAVTYEE